MLKLFGGELGILDTFRYVEDSLDAGLWSWDLKTNAMEWSHGIFKLFGLQPGTITPHFDLFAEMIHPEDRLPAYEVRRSIAGTPLHRKFRIIWRDGRVRWVHNKSETLIGSDGNATRAVGVMRDITAERTALRELQISEERLQALTAAVGAWVWTANMDGSAIAVESWKELRVDRTDVAHGNTWIDFIHPDDRDAALNAWSNARARYAPCEVEHRLLQPDGSYRWQLSRAVPVKSANDKVEEYVGVTLDIHATKVLPPMADVERQLTGAQIRAARGILRWSVRDLADQAKVSAATVRRLEEGDGASEDDAIKPISHALEAAGVTFFAATTGKPGVSPR